LPPRLACHMAGEEQYRRRLKRLIEFDLSSSTSRTETTSTCSEDYVHR
jgi:predicted secreted protein